MRKRTNPTKAFSEKWIGPMRNPFISPYYGACVAVIFLSQGPREPKSVLRFAYWMVPWLSTNHATEETENACPA
jgi:hypothetical protein